MNYGVYRNARDASWRCLIDCEVSELPVKPVRIARHYGIICKEPEDSVMGNASGKIFCESKTGTIIIATRRSESSVRRRYTIMHELGHYLLGHAGHVTTPKEEYQAERFAADVLMPACVLWGLRLHTADDIAEACGVSYTAAERRAERMELLYKRDAFLTHPLERQVYRQFEGYIKSNNK